VWHYFEKQFNDELLPLTAQSPKHSDAVAARKGIKDNLEAALDQSLDKTIMAAVGYCRYLLKTEQKKADFLTDDLNSLTQSSTGACRKVIEYLGRCITQMKSSLDGENIEIVLSEFGIRFHSLIFEHLQTYQYSFTGGMLAICDIKVPHYTIHPNNYIYVIGIPDSLENSGCHRGRQRIRCSPRSVQFACRCPRKPPTSLHRKSIILFTSKSNLRLSSGQCPRNLMKFSP